MYDLQQQTFGKHDKLHTIYVRVKLIQTYVNFLLSNFKFKRCFMNLSLGVYYIVHNKHTYANTSIIDRREHILLGFLQNIRRVSSHISQSTLNILLPT